MTRSTKVKELAGFIWGVADLLRGDYKQADYGKVILPFTVLRRLDCVLEPTKAKVMTFYETKAKALNVSNLEPVLNSQAGLSFHNISKFDFQKLKEDPDNLAANLKNYINGFSASGREIMEYFRFNEHIDRLDNANILLLVLKKFAATDLHPEAVSSMEMGYVFEETHPQVFRTLQRNRGRALHPARSDSPDGQRAASQRHGVAATKGRRENHLRPRVWHGRDALDCRGLHPRTQRGRQTRRFRSRNQPRELRDLQERHAY